MLPLSKEIDLLKQKRDFSIDLSDTYRTTLDMVIETAKNPYGLWVKLDSRTKKKLYYFFFESNISYDMKNCYRTAKPSILYRFFDDFSKNSRYVEMAGIEPACKKFSLKSLRA